MDRRKCLLALLVVISVLAAGLLYKKVHRSSPLPEVPPPYSSAIAAIEPFIALNNGRWIRSLRTADGTIYFHGGKLSRDGGRTFEAQTSVDLEDLTAAPERASISYGRMFYAVDGPVEFERPGVYRVKTWRSGDDLKTLTTESARIEIPDGPVRARLRDEWYGLYVYRVILAMPDGSWRMTMYGNFKEDDTPPRDLSSLAEEKYLMRSIVLSSQDQGHSWQYLSTIAVPRDNDPVGEGFVEPALTRVADGRLLAIMRTGHYFPLYASWSSDGGKSWTPPMYTGLDRGCDPHLITLADGRLALSWGRRFAEGWSHLHDQGDVKRFVWPGETILNLAISDDGGETWVNHRIAKKIGSGYSSIFEVEPNVLLVQSDEWVWRVTLRPKAAEH